MNRVQIKIADAQQKLDWLTPKQRAIGALWASGHTAHYIAASLGIATRTVEDHKNRILETLRLGGFADFVALWAIAHLTDFDD
jgi:DNA-binding CsgD family transcriptional regulator